MSDRVFGSKNEFYGFKNSVERARYCKKRADRADDRGRSGAAEFWRKEAGEAAVEAMDDDYS